MSLTVNVTVLRSKQDDFKARVYSAKRPTTDWLLERELRKTQETEVQVRTSRKKIDSMHIQI